MMRWIALLLLPAALLLATACEEEEDEGTAAPTVVVEVTDTPVTEPTATALPPEPTATPVPPEPTEPPPPPPTNTPAPPPPPPTADLRADCHPSYPDVCLKRNAGDYDCAGGTGNGPNYVAGPIRVLPPDPFDLDRDGDGWGCE